MDRSGSQIEIKNDELQELLQLPPKWLARWGLTILFVLLLITFLVLSNISIPRMINSGAMLIQENETEYILDIRISQEQFSDVKLNQDIVFLFYILPDKEYKGKIAAVSPILKKDFSLNIQGKIPKTKGAKDLLLLKPGMKAQAKIILENTSILHVIM